MIYPFPLTAQMGTTLTKEESGAIHLCPIFKIVGLGLPCEQNKVVDNCSTGVYRNKRRIQTNGSTYFSVFLFTVELSKFTIFRNKAKNALYSSPRFLSG